MRHAERFSRGAEYDNGSISQKHQNKGCCRVHIGNFSWGFGLWVGVFQIDDLTAGVGVSYDPLSHSRHNGEV